MFTPSGCKDIGIKNFEFVAKTQFLFSVIIIVCNINNSPPPSKKEELSIDI